MLIGFNLLKFITFTVLNNEESSFSKNKYSDYLTFIFTL